MFTNVLLGVTVVLLGILLWRLRTPGRDTRALQECGELRAQLEKERSEKDEQAGKSKQLFMQCTHLEAEQKAVRKERDTLADRIANFEAEHAQRLAKHEEMSGQLESAKRALEDEKLRVRREDEEKKQQELADRDRLWAEHEQSVVALLVDLCKKPQCQFTTFTNTNLPDGFDGSFKPDFCVAFLGQYIVFDAKVSRSQDLKLYIKDQVKKTATKAKTRTDIYPSIFLVVPTEAISALTEFVHFEAGFTFYVVSPEALAPILGSLKRIESYDLAEQFDPQERENFVSLIARLDQHINVRNSLDVILATMGAELLADAKKFYPEIAKEIEREKQKIRIPQFKHSELRKLVGDLGAREEEVSKLTRPQAAIEMLSA